MVIAGRWSDHWLVNKVQMYQYYFNMPSLFQEIFKNLENNSYFCRRLW